VIEILKDREDLPGQGREGGIVAVAGQIANLKRAKLGGIVGVECRSACAVGDLDAEVGPSQGEGIDAATAPFTPARCKLVYPIHWFTRYKGIGEDDVIGDVETESAEVEAIVATAAI